MTWTAIQYNAAHDDSGNDGLTIVAAFDAGVIEGNLLVVTVGWGSSGQPAGTVAITDTQLHVYTACGAIHTDATNGQHQQTFCAVAGATAANTVTATFSAVRTFRRLSISEFNGNHPTAPFDQSTGQLQASPGTGIDAVTSGAIVPSVDGCLVYGWTQNTVEGDPGTGVIAPGTLFTPTEGDDATPEIFIGEWREQDTAGSVAATFTLTVDHRFVTSAVSFVPAEIDPSDDPVQRNSRSNVPPQVRL